MSTPTDPFAGLPAPSFFNSDPTALAQSFIIGYQSGFQAATGTPLTLGKADPRYYEQLYNAFLISQTYANGNLVAYQNCLRYATGVNLDVLGSFWGELGKRLPASGSLTTIIFSTQFPVGSGVPIPAGTVVSTSGTNTSTIVNFTTTQDVTILAGTTSISAIAQCVVTGAIGNGFQPGQITTLGSLNSPYVVTASNATVSSGGADSEPDDAFRRRLWMAPKALSTCGTKDGYEYYALSANASIVNVSAWSNPGISGTVMIAALIEGGQPSTPEINALILASCNPTNNRPLADQVIVTSPSGAPYSISLSYYIPKSLSSNVVNINTSVTNVVSAYRMSTQSVLGGYIDPTPLETGVAGLGCVGVVVAEPTFYACNPWEQPVLVDDPIVTYNGLI